MNLSNIPPLVFVIFPVCFSAPASHCPKPGFQSIIPYAPITAHKPMAIFGVDNCLIINKTFANSTKYNKKSEDNSLCALINTA